ncbi:MAG: hypothetical protein OSA87_05160 [Woeseiaceae bacterium]|nr:hypothetical protein [Woeseiaceae bacterium]
MNWVSDTDAACVHRNAMTILSGGSWTDSTMDIEAMTLGRDWLSKLA